MTANVRKIEIDAETAKLLEARAAASGMSVSDLVAQLAILEIGSAETVAEQIAELDRRWKAIENGEQTIPHDDVVRWLETWGTPAFRPWRDR
jgi:predicted transcriptional regulator